MSCKYKSGTEQSACTLSQFSPSELWGDEYCCFHLPFDAQDIGGHTKSDWPSNKINEFNRALSNVLSRGNKLDLSGTYIPVDLILANNFSELDISNSHIKGCFTYKGSNLAIPISAHDTIFENNVEFHNGRTPIADLSGSSFLKDLTFSSINWNELIAKNSVIESDLKFQNCTISKAIFNDIKVKGRILSTGAINSSGLIDFSKVKFNEGSSIQVNAQGPCRFNGASFASGMNFIDCNFGNSSTFRGLKTGDNVSFTKCYFGERTTFAKNGSKRTKFGKKNKFNSVNFGLNCDFSDSLFGIGFSFQKGSISAGSNFNNVTFGSQVKLMNLTIDRTSFCEATFENIAKIEGCTFNRTTDFSKIRFIKTTEGTGALSFSSSTFNGKALFTDCRFDGPVSFKYESFQDVDFSRTHFKSKAMFLNRKFMGSTNFGSCIFELAPMFHGSDLHQDTSFIKTKFNDVKSVSAVASYRTLRLAMEQQRSKRYQSLFHALELESATNSGEIEGVSKLLSQLYGFFSNYGLQAGLPLFHFVWINSLSCLIYYIYGNKYGLVDIFSFIPFTIEQIVRPFYVWTSAYRPTGLLSGIWSDVSLEFQVLASLQSLINIGVITLFLLAIRRQFKMD